VKALAGCGKTFFGVIASEAKQSHPQSNKRLLDCRVACASRNDSLILVFPQTVRRIIKNLPDLILGSRQRKDRIPAAEIAETAEVIWDCLAVLKIPAFSEKMILVCFCFLCVLCVLCGEGV
jgi:hypothetical protein